VQAAQHFAREAFGDDRIDALPPLRVERDHATTRVTLGTDAGSVEVRLGEQMSAPLLSQCSATVEGQVRTFVLEAIEPAR
jgi:hypothetical protein